MAEKPLFLFPVIEPLAYLISRRFPELRDAIFESHDDASHTYYFEMPSEAVQQVATYLRELAQEPGVSCEWVEDDHELVVRFPTAESEGIVRAAASMSAVLEWYVLQSAVEKDSGKSISTPMGLEEALGHAAVIPEGQVDPRVLLQAIALESCLRAENLFNGLSPQAADEALNSVEVANVHVLPGLQLNVGHKGAALPYERPLTLLRGALSAYGIDAELSADGATIVAGNIGKPIDFRATVMQKIAKGFNLSFEEVQQRVAERQQQIGAAARIQRQEQTIADGMQQIMNTITPQEPDPRDNGRLVDPETGLLTSYKQLMRDFGHRLG